MDQTQFLIVIGVTVVVAIAARILRARMKAPAPIGRHDALIKRAEVHVESSAFLKKAIRDYRATGHLSERQVEAVEKAIERAESSKSKLH